MAAGDDGLDGEIVKIVKKRFEGRESVCVSDLETIMKILKIRKRRFL